MKTEILTTLLLLVVVSRGLALQCKRCVPLTAGGRCYTTTETCSSEGQACVSARFLTYPYSYFKRCMSLSDCRTLQYFTSVISIKCCQTDFCNAY